MVKKSFEDVMAHLDGKYWQRQRRARWLIARDYGKPGEQMPEYFPPHETVDSERVRNKITQTKNKCKITLPKVKWGA